MHQTVRRRTISDVARAAGVSKAAVSFAFNSPDRLSTETVARIRDVATELGYRPDPVARMLAQRRTMTVGILTPQPLELMFPESVLRRADLGHRERGRTGGLCPPVHLPAARLAGPGRP